MEERDRGRGWSRRETREGQEESAEESGEDMKRERTRSERQGMTESEGREKNGGGWNLKSKK